MRIIHDGIDGNLIVSGDTIIDGHVSGSVQTAPGARLQIRGSVKGDVRVNVDSAAEIHGKVGGVIINEGVAEIYGEVGAVRGDGFTVIAPSALVRSGIDAVVAGAWSFPEQAGEPEARPA